MTGGSSDSTSFTVTNDSSWYEYTVTATNQAGESAAVPAVAPRPSRPPRRLTRRPA